MNIKCKICGLKGKMFSGNYEVSEFHASRFMYISIPNKAFEGTYICRRCINSVLSSLGSEQYRIDKLYEPEIKEKKK